MACSDPKPVCEAGAMLGEGPLWDERDRCLWFVDIKGHQVHRYDPSDGGHRIWDAPGQVCFLFPAKGGGFVAGLPDGLYRFEPEQGFEKLIDVEGDNPRNRLNDGTVDPSGRLWFGTMDDQETDKTGAFYCFAGGRISQTGIGGMVVTNGPAVSPDGKTLYVVDTFERTIDRCAINDDGSLGKRLPFVEIEEGAGFPDGPTVDSEGALWIGLYHGWEARRYSPSGELIGRVPFPVSNITKLAFGGEDLRTVYATTAKLWIDPDKLVGQPLAGHLFEFRCDVAGVPCPSVPV